MTTGALLRQLSRALVLTAVPLTMLLSGPAPAEAQSVQVLRTEELVPGVQHQVLQVRLPDGATAIGQLVRWQEDQAGLELRPRLARDTVAGLETMPDMARRALTSGGVVGVNGGYFLPRPQGAPNGPFALDGNLRSGPAVGSSGGRLTEGRGTIGIRPGGQVLLDRVQPELTLTAPSGSWSVDEVNRQPRCPAAGSVTCPSAGEVLLYDDGFGTSADLPIGTTYVTLDAARLPASGRLAATVTSVRPLPDGGSVAVPPGQLVLAAHGSQRGTALAGLVPGAPVTIDVSMLPAGTPAGSWNDLQHALAGAPLLLRGQVQQPALFSTAADWHEREALGDAHRLGRQPRTAIGRTGTGELLLLTVDGRQAGWSVGVTLLELTRTFEQLGATDAVNLDGGGSTTMTMHGTIVNRPSESGRGNSSGLFLHVPERTWYLRDPRSGGPATSTASFSFVGDQVLACDFDGDGRDTPVTFRRGRWVASNQPDGTGSLSTFEFGIQPGDLALCGDWTGDGRDGIGVQRGSVLFLRDTASSGPPDHEFGYGRVGDIAVVGDWNGNGQDTIGVRRGDRYFLRNRLSGGPADRDFHYGRPADTPVVGDWNGNGRDSLGVRRGDRYFIRNWLSGGPANLDYHYGRASDLPVSGDWNGDGLTSLGVIR